MISGRELRSHMPVQCGRKKKKKEVKESEKIVHRDISFKKFQGEK